MINQIKQAKTREAAEELFKYGFDEQTAVEIAKAIKNFKIFGKRMETNKTDKIFVLKNFKKSCSTQEQVGQLRHKVVQFWEARQNPAKTAPQDSEHGAETSSGHTNKPQGTKRLTKTARDLIEHGFDERSAVAIGKLIKNVRLFAKGKDPDKFDQKFVMQNFSDCCQNEDELEQLKLKFIQFCGSQKKPKKSKKEEEINQYLLQGGLDPTVAETVAKEVGTLQMFFNSPQKTLRKELCMMLQKVPDRESQIEMILKLHQSNSAQGKADAKPDSSEAKSDPEFVAKKVAKTEKTFESIRLATTERIRSDLEATRQYVKELRHMGEVTEVPTEDALEKLGIKDYRFRFCKNLTIAKLKKQLKERCESLERVLNSSTESPSEGQISNMFLLGKGYYFWGLSDQYLFKKGSLAGFIQSVQFDRALTEHLLCENTNVFNREDISRLKRFLGDFGTNFRQNLELSMNEVQIKHAKIPRTKPLNKLNTREKNYPSFRFVNVYFPMIAIYKPRVRTMQIAAPVIGKLAEIIRKSSRTDP